jgi:BlaI family penicillinase repressor
MKVLWDRSAQWLAAAEIIEPISRQRQVHHRTVRTMLARLARKGAVETRPAASGSGYLYRAKVGRETAVRVESRSFLSRVFDGNAAPALVHFLKESRDLLSPQEIKELQALFNKKEKP